MFISFHNIIASLQFIWATPLLPPAADMPTDMEPLDRVPRSDGPDLVAQPPHFASLPYGSN